MEIAYEILIDGLKKYGAEIIGGGLFFVTLWLWRRYQKKIISGMRFALLFVLAVIAAVGLYALVSFLGGAFMLGFGSAGMIGLVIWAVNRFRSGKPAEVTSSIKDEKPEEENAHVVQSNESTEAASSVEDEKIEGNPKETTPTENDKPEEEAIPEEEEQEIKPEEKEPEEEYDIIRCVPIIELPLVEMLMANLFEGNVKWDNSSDINIDYSYYRQWRNRRAIYWLERAAEHGYPKAQRDLIERVYGQYGYGSMHDDAKAYMWAYIGDLYEEYEKNLRVVDMNIRRTKIYKGASKYVLEFIQTSNLGVIVYLSAAEMEAAKEEAKARFEKMRRFMDAQIEAYKTEHADEK